MNVSINQANALGINVSPPVRSGKISAAVLMTRCDGGLRGMRREIAAEARGVARPIDNIS
jgi:hypothetical protein